MTRRTLTQLSILTLVTTAALASSASAQTLFSDNFDTETPNLAATTLTNFDVTRDNLDVIGSGAGGSLFDLYPGNGYYLDLGGSSGFAQITSKSSFLLTPGTYNLTFLLGKNGGGTNTLTASLGSAFTTTISDSLTYPSLVTQSFDFTVGSTTTANLLFDYPNNGSNSSTQGYILDGIVLSRTSSVAAPEPATLALVALGGLAFARRRRH